MEPVSGGSFLWWRHKKEKREDVRLSQDVLISTLNQLHIELDALREDYNETTDQQREEITELSIALAECDRERVRLMIKLQEMTRGNPSGPIGDHQSSRPERSDLEIQQGESES